MCVSSRAPAASDSVSLTSEAVVDSTRPCAGCPVRHAAKGPRWFAKAAAEMGLCGSKQAVGASGDADAPAKPAPSTGSESKAPTAAPSSPIRALRVESGDLDSSAGGGAGADDAGPGIDVVLSHHQYTNSPVIGKRAADGPADEGGGVDSPGVALDHHESRVMMALSTKRLAMQRHRRHDIKAESFKDVLSTMHEEETDMTFERKVIEKDEASRQFIRDALGANFLFAGLNDETTEFVVDAVDKRHFSAGDTVVKQGDDGDHFYVLQKGQCDVAVNGSPQGKIDQGGHFGDLSLLYNTPIASTITAAQDCVFWTLDRRSFRTLIVQTNARDIHANYKFLRKCVTVPFDVSAACRVAAFALPSVAAPLCRFVRALL